MPRRRFATRSLSALLLFLMLPQLTGCTQWNIVTTPVAKIGPQKPDAVFRLHRRTGATLDVRALRIVGDSAHGIIWSPDQQVRPDSIRVIALTDIRAAERKGSSTAAIVSGVVLLFVLAGVAFAASDPCLAAFC